MDFFTVLKLSGYPVSEAIKRYQEILNAQSEGYQNKQKWQIFNDQIRINPFYRDFVGVDIQGNWERIPIIQKSHLMGAYQDKISPEIIRNGLYVSRTSGSTGTPMLFARQNHFHVMVWLAANRLYSQFGFDVNSYQARFYGIPLSGFNFYREKLKDLMAKRYRFVVYDLGDKVLKKWVDVFNRKRFEVIYGYTNSILQFSNYLKEKGLVLSTFCPSLKACVVTSEMCSGEEQAQLHATFGVPVYNEYGASEVCVIGFRDKNVWKVADEMVYLEVVDDNGAVLQDGEAGRLLVTLLHNNATPIIRYEIGDLATIKREGEHTIITSLQGRMNDTGLLPSGKRVPGLTFYYAVHEAIGKDIRIKEHQVVQKDTLSFQVNVCLNGDLSSNQIKAIKSAFNLYLEEGLKIEVKQVKSIERTAKGKFKHFISEI
ncbi:phenylacetate--CoA ligase family protein [Carboxylicivirga linearis]|uniref:Phenylacetate--CoA ligase family protein n=1 Tax=Carboxylicivirga linearis TaxID=1628157 RepID=A0ABS5JW02_9BACT|nr:phenylacetate--CoA ligase family protein [Carboxylicivirga linearis]MBS2099067.1 phenylacetate--CoA ligase family protein [Carboxylicivirga linearis]